MTHGPVDPRLLNGLEWRCIGPPRGGRVLAVAGDPKDPAVFYFGAVAGGVWKTYDGGTYWENVSDGYFKTSSVGAIAVSDSDPNVVYAGTGEASIRVVPSYGDGVYRSTDAGKTWKHMGLEDTRHIGRIRVHPKNPDIVYVAALGHAFGPNEQRAASFARPMEGRLGSTSCTRARRRVRSTYRWTPATPAYSTPPSGRCGATSGL